MRTAALLVGAFILSLSLTHFYRTVAIGLRIVAEPNARSAHRQATPTGAGLGFVLVSALAIGLYVYRSTVGVSETLFVLLPVFAVALLGFVDDLKDLPWKIRLTAQVMCCAAVMLVIDFPVLVLGEFFVQPGLAGEVLGVFCLVVFLNFYNFMDGIDGIAASEGVFVLLAAVCFAVLHGLPDVYLVPSLVVAVCLASFLVLNRPVARVFMGDIGAGFLGLFFGVLMLSEAMIPVWAWLILLGCFIMDAGTTILIRLWRREQLHQAHSQHAYQHLNRRWGTWKTLGLVHAVNVLWLLPLAWQAAQNPTIGLFLLVLAYLPLGIGCIFFGAGRPADGTTHEH